MTVMLESKIEATHRLQRSGQWNAASLYRDRERLRLRADGKTRTEAREGAWQSMSERFRPPDEFAPDVAETMQFYPPRIPDADKPWELAMVWQAVWTVVTRVAEFDQPLRRALGIDGLETTYLDDLYYTLSADEQWEVRVERAQDSSSIEAMMSPRPEPLLRWAWPQLSRAVETVDRESLNTDYERWFFEFLERLVDAWALLEESCEFFWRDVRPEER